ncbi:hypothetical protein NTE_01180 [Candidatus Nitrososphaera evergladensis SR1]|uniref:Uncharacterized protein n=1 Tax=Candidatus Nitrososphaera evergladensis SR1 TaxID=1459636 RepID=A0A075MQ01_9ARCH|nr:hypothetical protein [Candidatus Nitrososphaera evergladensis]AIF83253.1 hypothetical protein NTE_01180 [Candidatus Nitrososphaera evergladensis SR1]
MASCLELATCDPSTFGGLFNFFTYPLEVIFGGFFVMIAWGIILMIIFLRTHNPMLTSFVGLFIASFFVGTATFATPATAGATNVAWLLVAISMGSVLYFLIRSKAQNPSGT